MSGLQRHARAGAVVAARKAGRDSRPTPTSSAKGVVAERMLELQRLAGNRAVTQLIAQGNGAAGALRLHGLTTGTFDGGTGTVSGIRHRRATDCDCPDESPCLRLTGTLTIRYGVDVDIQMPEVPAGLTECQQRRVRDFLRNVLRPHENEHARRFRTYNGTTRHTVSANGCGREEASAALEARAQDVHDAEEPQRQSAARALSDAIDPFERDIDLNC